MEAWSKVKKWWYKAEVYVISIGIILCFSFAGGYVGWVLGSFHEFKKNLRESESIAIITDAPPFYYETPEKALREALEYYGVAYPDVVYAQAVHETGHFKSRVCREYNNLFGLYNSRKGDYYRFNHWTESVVAYRDMIQGGHRYDEHYYDYLKKIGYAEDKDYINKVRRIANETRDQGRHSTRDTVP